MLQYTPIPRPHALTQAFFMLLRPALVLRTIFKSTHRSPLLLLISLRSIPTSRSALFLLAFGSNRLAALRHLNKLRWGAFSRLCRRKKVGKGDTEVRTSYVPGLTNVRPVAALLV
jgi:hypothetical protein